MNIRNPIVKQKRVDLILKTYAQKKRLIKNKDYNALKKITSCQHCKKKTKSEERLQIHHVIPLSHGGTNERDNLIAICSSCHKKAHQKRHKKK